VTSPATPPSKVGRFGGVYIACGRELRGVPQCHPEGGAPKLDVRFRKAPVRHEGVLVYSWGGRYGLTLFRLPAGWVFRCRLGAEFQLDRAASRLICYPGPAGWSPEVADVLVRRILPRAVQLLGRFVLHGAAVAGPGGAIVLLGASGSGKSTLALSLTHTVSAYLLADDAAVLSRTEESFAVTSSAAVPCLWADSLAAFADRIGSAELMSAYGSKFRCEQAAAPPAEPRPLRAVYLLDRHHQVESTTVTPLPPTEALLALMRCQLRFDPTDAAAEARRLEFFRGVAETLPVLRLNYPRRFQHLPEVGDLILDLSRLTA